MYNTLGFFSTRAYYIYSSFSGDPPFCMATNAKPTNQRTSRKTIHTLMSNTNTAPW